MTNPNDTHAGARRGAMRILEQTGLFRGLNAPTKERVLAIIEGQIKLTGSNQPFIQSPFRIGELIAGAHVAMAALCILLESVRSNAPPRTNVTAEIDVIHAAFVGYAPFLSEWTSEGECERGHFAEISEAMNNRLAKEMAKAAKDLNSNSSNGAIESASAVTPGPTTEGAVKDSPLNKAASESAPATSTGPTTEEVRDPPAGTPSHSPIFTTFRAYLSCVHATKDRHVFFFLRLTDDPKKLLLALNFTSDQADHLIRLSLPTLQTHPDTYITHHREFLRLVKEHLATQSSFDIENAFNKISAICIVPRTRAEFEKTPQGLALGKVPRAGVERSGVVREPWTEDEWDDVLKGRVHEQVGGLWKETGWTCGSVGTLDPSRGVLYGLKVLEITRIVAGPQIGLQLSSLGSDSMRVTSPDIIDYPAHDFFINLGKRTVELDLKKPEHKKRLKELIMDADVMVANLLAGSLEKLGFGFKDVLKMIEGRGKGIVYAETNTFSFYGPLAKLPGVENLGQHMSGISVAQAEYQPFDKPLPKPKPVVTPILFCDITTGLHTATGILTALYKRSTTGGSYLVRSSLTQTALAVQDLGTYTDPDMIRKLWDGMPPIYANINPDPAAGTVAAELGYMMLMPVWMKEKRVHGTRFESGYWIKTLDFPFGGTAITLKPPIQLSIHGKNLEHIRFASRPLRYDSHVGFLFDSSDPPGAGKIIKELEPTREPNTFRCKPRKEVQEAILNFVREKGKGAEIRDGARL